MEGIHSRRRHPLMVCTFCSEYFAESFAVFISLAASFIRDLANARSSSNNCTFTNRTLDRRAMAKEPSGHGQGDTSSLYENTVPVCSEKPHGRNGDGATSNGREQMTTEAKLREQTDVFSVEDAPGSPHTLSRVCCSLTSGYEFPSLRAKLGRI